MADDYIVTTQRQTIQVLASGAVIDVEAVGFVTRSYNVHAEVLVPLKDWQDGKTHEYAEPLARGIEHLIREGLASSASFVQDVDPASGQLADFMEFTVSYKAPHVREPMTTTVRVPIAEVASHPDGEPAKLLKAAAHTLKQTAEL